MNNNPIDFNNLPEPFKDMLGKIDPALFEKILKMYDTKTINQMLDSMLPMLKNNLTQEQIDSLKKMIAEFNK